MVRNAKEEELEAFWTRIPLNRFLYIIFSISLSYQLTDKPLSVHVVSVFFLYTTPTTQCIFETCHIRHILTEIWREN